MSITDYTEDAHPSGFKGYAVRVQIAGDHHQKYFSTSRGQNKLAQFARAHELHADLLKKKEKVTLGRNRLAHTTHQSEYTTPVRGISYNHTWENTNGYKFRSKQKKFIVQGQQFGERFNKTFYGDATGWKRAVKYLAGKKGISRYSHLTKRCPI